MGIYHLDFVQNEALISETKPDMPHSYARLRYKPLTNPCTLPRSFVRRAHLEWLWIPIQDAVYTKSFAEDNSSNALWLVIGAEWRVYP